jgi:hypothetical protein
MLEEERLQRMLAWCGTLNRLRYDFLSSRNPGASEAEIIALWTEQTYRGTVDDGFLDRALAAIRSQGLDRG